MKKIKIYQINLFYKLGSTGNLIFDLFQIATKNDIEMRIAARNSDGEYNEYYKCTSRREKTVHSILSRITGLQGYFSKQSTLDLIDDIKRYEPDLIHLHNLHGHYINLGILFQFLREYEKPIIWTLHDCWAFTGNCAYYTCEQCTQWKQSEGCNHCPNKRNYPFSYFFDRSHKMFQDKKNLYGKGMDINFVCVSNWLRYELLQSFLYVYKARTIYNYVDTSVFKIMEEIRSNKDNNQIILLGVCSVWSKLKGIEEIIHLSFNLPKNMYIILIGHMNKIYRKMCKKSGIRLVGKLSSKEELIKYYNKADYVLSLSKAETFGMTVAEGQSCGTPAIVLNSTGIKELVDDNTGILIDRYDSNEIIEKINIFESNKKKRSQFYCRTKAELFYSKERQCQKYIELYKELAKKNERN